MQQMDRTDRKSTLFDMMIELAEKEFNIAILKNTSQRSRPQQTETKRNDSFCF